MMKAKLGLLTNEWVTGHQREGIPEAAVTEAGMKLKLQVVTLERMDRCSGDIGEDGPLQW